MPADSARSRGLAVSSALPRLTAAAVSLLMAGCGPAAAGGPAPD